MERIITESTTEQQLTHGQRTLTIQKKDAADLLHITLTVQRQEDVSHIGDAPHYSPTGNVADNGQIIDELHHLTTTLSPRRYAHRA